MAVKVASSARRRVIARPVGERRSGPVTLFPGKERDSPITFTAQKAQHVKLARAIERLGITKADVMCLLIDKFADTVTVR